MKCGNVLIAAVLFWAASVHADSKKRVDLTIGDEPLVSDDVEFSQFSWPTGKKCDKGALASDGFGSPTSHWDFTLRATNLSGQTKAISPLAIDAHSDGAGPTASSSSGLTTVLIAKPGEMVTWKWSDDCVSGSVKTYTVTAIIESRGAKKASPPDQIVVYRGANGKRGLRYRRSQKLVVEARFDSVLDPSEGLAAVITDKNSPGYGFIDMTGTLVIPEKYKNVALTNEGKFKDGKVRVCEDIYSAVCYFIDKTGAKVP